MQISYYNPCCSARKGFMNKNSTKSSTKHVSAGSTASYSPHGDTPKDAGFCSKEAGSGYKAWLGYSALETGTAARYVHLCRSICARGSDPLVKTAALELKTAFKSLTGNAPRMVRVPSKNGSVVLEVLSEKPSGDSPDPIQEVPGQEGYIIKHVSTGTGQFLLIAGRSGAGVLYGVFALLRLIQCGSFSENCHIADGPATALRMLNQWDNMDGSIERGYAGRSIFFDKGYFINDTERIRDYARLMASVGLNGIVLNNVNVHRLETRLITKEYLPLVSRTADIFRQYGIKTFLSINYCSPMELGGLSTADPLDEGVQAWWSEKASEIYDYIPDFGGFLVKADSEFRPGPFTYGRNHAEGANMLAAALKPYGGLVIWRCFVYNCTQDWRDRVTDRANAAYDNFMALDGCFADNVLLQIKNGPMDFQVREPVSPLIGGLKHTSFLLEFQITQEYTGQQKHLCYLAPMWKEVLDFDTHMDGTGSTVRQLLSDAPAKGMHTGFAAISNIGDDCNWTGHDLAQANLYCYGRLAWDPGLSPEAIASEWVRQTFGSQPFVFETITDMLLRSYSIYESYTAPLGIGWMVNPNHHYGPSVDGYEYSAWGTYHRADCHGIGVDRSVALGTGYAGRYHEPNSTAYEHPGTCPEELLLFFHHIPYTYKLQSGTALIQYIYDSHFEGAEQAAVLVKRWEALHGRIHPECHARVLKRLQEQAIHACEWRDVINSYFYRKSGIPDEKGRRIY